MIGTSPSTRKPPAIPADPVVHAKDFALRYCELPEAIARVRMREACVLEDRIGMLDADFNTRWTAEACIPRPATST